MGEVLRHAGEGYGVPAFVGVYGIGTVRGVGEGEVSSGLLNYFASVLGS